MVIYWHWQNRRLLPPLSTRPRRRGSKPGSARQPSKHHFRRGREPVTCAKGYYGEARRVEQVG